MRFENIYNYPEVSLFSGLELISRLPFLRLYSDGLESDEYFQYIPDKGISYEDGCLIGVDADHAITRLNECQSLWHKTAKFYLDIRIHFEPYDKYILDELQYILNDVLKNNEVGKSHILHPNHCIKFSNVPNEFRGFEHMKLYIMKRRNNS